MANPLTPEGWFRKRGWKPFDFQRETWLAVAAGESGLLHSTTGTGKTYAAFFAALAEARRTKDSGGGLRVLWITPLRALAADTEAALAVPLAEIWPDWNVGRRTGDTSSYTRKKIAQKPPEVLVTTPESLSVMLSQPDFLRHFCAVSVVIVDEWHELLSTKRGVLLELSLARLRSLSPGLRLWGLSATLGNTEEAATVLGGFQADGSPRPMRIIRGQIPKKLTIKSLLPPAGERYPWGGHLGLQLLPGVAALLRKHQSSILFTNTRSQAELWFRALEDAMPDWAGQIGLHHGSLSNEVRAEAEEGLKSGRLRAVVSTSSLDLGVDFAPVDAVLQIGSPKGVARLMQRAGRSGHQPGAESRVYCVPANTFELVEIAAARDLAEAGAIEGRTPLHNPLDVLCQHLATVAAGGMAPGTPGFPEKALKSEVRSTHAYHTLSDDEWTWALDFSARGGASLHNYPQFVRMRVEAGRYILRDEAFARQHRLGIGTITSDASISVQFANGQRLGSVEESFLAKMRPGDRFLFSGRSLELIRVRDLRALVRVAKAGPRGVPRWMGGRLPLSSRMSAGVRARFEAARSGQLDSPEMERLRSILEIQASVSRIPAANDLLVERLTSREGHHLFLYPFEGRLVHEGLASLFAYRLGRIEPLSFSLAFNDYGLEILSPTAQPWEQALEAGLFREENLLEDILGSINASELARRQFREIARIAGLTPEGVGHARKSARQLLVSSSLLYDVFHRYEPSNRLLHQATREVLENQLEESRLRATLEAMQRKQLHLIELNTPSPFSYPLFVERFRQQLSSEKLTDRIRRMEIVMEKSRPSRRG
jgi:ATP-dependent Lhr-like helicase